MLAARTISRRFSTKRPIELGYYNIKGLLEPARWICCHYNIPYVEWNPQSDADWEEKKKELGAFPSLPYLKDGDLVITESSTFPSSIPYYLAEKSGNPDFLGKDAAERAKLKMYESMLKNIILESLRIIGLGKDADHKGEFGKLLAKDGNTYRTIQFISETLANKDFIFGHLTWLDFLMQFTARFTGAIMYSHFGYSPYADVPNIVKLVTTVTSLPGVKERLDFAQPVPYLVPETVPFKLLNFKEMIDAGLNPI